MLVEVPGVEEDDRWVADRLMLGRRPAMLPGMRYPAASRTVEGARCGISRDGCRPRVRTVGSDRRWRPVAPRVAMLFRNAVAAAERATT
ncbi:hypothetical protein C1I93_26555 [Micromonospora endophytica]|uniref:Uncharacterized protein n=1 Tax=Micromonospora endophytica TaxID=515350 RepID=A0A2W2BJC6_9ACTN|nr:hypothetical protein C1I93_26555 [Micromonospora endophytica]